MCFPRILTAINDADPDEKDILNWSRGAAVAARERFVATAREVVNARNWRGIGVLGAFSGVAPQTTILCSTGAGIC
ncbi:hypothetical protein SBBP1_290018 [Burkholderiales bacterium]|nr:hypothetical protein SBBP1_290018 [Burkholderiales bacterium]